VDRLEPAPLETIGKTMLPATPIRRVAPSTPEGIRNRIHGVIPVDVTIQIGKNGSVVSARAANASGDDGVRAYLAQRAVEAVRQWKFQPARIDNEAVPGELTVRFRFRSSGAQWD
jgi:TonB family protein